LVAQSPVTTTKGSCTLVGNNAICDSGGLPAFVTVTIVIPFTVPRFVRPETVVFTPFVFSSSPDRNPLNNGNSVTTTVLPSGDLNGDGKVDLADLVLVLDQWTK
jgi:hypothetical protein